MLCFEKGRAVSHHFCFCCLIHVVYYQWGLLLNMTKIWKRKRSLDLLCMSEFCSREIASRPALLSFKSQLLWRCWPMAQEKRSLKYILLGGLNGLAMLRRCCRVCALSLTLLGTEYTVQKWEYTSLVEDNAAKFLNGNQAPFGLDPVGQYCQCSGIWSVFCYCNQCRLFSNIGNHMNWLCWKTSCLHISNRADWIVMAALISVETLAWWFWQTTKYCTIVGRYFPV